MIDYLIPGIVKSNNVAGFANYRRFLHKRYFEVKQFKIRG